MRKTTYETYKVLVEENKKLQDLVNELSNQVQYQDIKIFSLQQILNKIEEYCDNSDDLYARDYDYDYEEELIVDYVPSHFKEGILNIIKGVDEEDD